MTAKRRVRFGDNVEHVFEKDFAPEDHPQIWYNSDEFGAIKAEIFTMMRTPYCPAWHWRGFEHVQQKRPRKAIRRKHVEELLYFQRVMNVKDPVDLGVLAASNTRETSQRARDLALLDETEAFAIYNEDEDGVPDAASISESSESDGEDNTCPLTFVSMDRDGDDKAVRLLQDLQSTHAEETALSLLYTVPFQIVGLIFPCIC